MLQPFLYEAFLFLFLACYQSKAFTQEQADQESEGRVPLSLVWPVGSCMVDHYDYSYNDRPLQAT